MLHQVDALRRMLSAKQKGLPIAAEIVDHSNHSGKTKRAFQLGKGDIEKLLPTISTLQCRKLVQLYRDHVQPSQEQQCQIAAILPHIQPQKDPESPRSLQNLGWDQCFQKQL